LIRQLRNSLKIPGKIADMKNATGGVDPILPRDKARQRTLFDYLAYLAVALGLAFVVYQWIYS
jgi:hypothetical protein